MSTPSPLRTLSDRSSQLALLASLALAMPVLVLDLLEAADVALAVLYAVAVLFALRVPGRGPVLGVAAVCTVLSVIGAVVPTLENPDWPLVLKNRSIGMLAIWGTALAGLRLRELTRAIQHGQAALQESESRFRSIFDTVRDPVFVYEITPDGRPLRFLEVNDAACRTYGYTRGELQNMDVAQLVSAPGVMESLDTLVERMRREGSILIDSEHHAKDGRRIPVEVRAQRIELGGREAVLSVARDITERKKNEQAIRESEHRERARADELQALMESVPAVVFIAHDPDCTRISGSRAAHELLGLPVDANLSLTAPTGEAPRHFRVYDRDGRELAPHELPVQRAARGEELHGHEESIRFDDGEQRWVYGNAVPLRDEAGQLRGAVAALVDITEHRRAQQRLERWKDELEQRVAARTADLAASERELEQRAHQLQRLTLELTQAEQRERRKLASILHDDIQQMLVAVKLQIGTLAQAGPDTLPEAIERLTGQLDGTIQSTRVLSHELSPQVLYDRGLADTLHWLAERKKETYGLDLHVDAEPAADTADEGVKVLLFQAVRELLLNVIKHARVDEASVVMRRRGDQLCVSVSDAGTGFDPDRARANASGAEHLGLFGIHERLEVFGGRMVVDSVPGRGTTVRLYAPVTNGATADAGSSAVKLAAGDRGD